MLQKLDTRTLVHVSVLLGFQDCLSHSTTCCAEGRQSGSVWVHSVKIRAATGGQSTGDCSDLAVPACRNTMLQLVGQTTFAPV